MYNGGRATRQDAADPHNRILAIGSSQLIMVNISAISAVVMVELCAMV
jgi:hypothetical protein